MKEFETQMSFFDGSEEFKIPKDMPIRLIELFAGIGAQASALADDIQGADVVDDVKHRRLKYEKKKKRKGNGVYSFNGFYAAERTGIQNTACKYYGSGLIC